MNPRVLIVEDEELAAERLAGMVKKVKPGIELHHILDSIEDTVSFLQSDPVDLLFLDIHLSDGKSFEIFEKTSINIPVIFTTAYDQYALDAFKVNSVDYLLKPIAEPDLERALTRYEQWFSQPDKSTPQIDPVELKKWLGQGSRQYKQRFMVKFGDHIQSKPVQDAAYFYAEGKTTYLVQWSNNRRYILDYTLEALDEKELNPTRFFRINRKFIINIEAINDVKTYSNSRLKVSLKVPSEMDMIVSRERVNLFKNWLEI